MTTLDAIRNWCGPQAKPPRAARAYLATFLALVLPALAVLMSFSLYQAPVQGDLTRVGGFTENAYGWTATHKRFVRVPMPAHARVYNPQMVTVRLPPFRRRNDSR